MTLDHTYLKEALDPLTGCHDHRRWNGGKSTGKHNLAHRKFVRGGHATAPALEKDGVNCGAGRMVFIDATHR